MSSHLFNSNLNAFFGTDLGAFSNVTDREYFDQQITVSGPEKLIFRAAFGSFGRGAVDDTPKFSLEFRLFPTGEKIFLKVNHPKSVGKELRLYIPSGVFRPSGGWVWFSYIKDKMIWIGALDQYSFDLIQFNGKLNDTANIIDLSDEIYQEMMMSTDLPENTTSIVNKIQRNPLLAKTVVDAATKCELLPELPVFLSKRSQKLYFEAHHIVPISLQPKFEFSLDVKENICALNPFSHRMLHHGRFVDFSTNLEKMVKKREVYFKKLGMSYQSVLEIYHG
jgi:5-methylcytosine-specific restriction enzyme A